MPREARYTRNQSLFREVNERIVELADTWSVNNLDPICECANIGCTQIIQVPRPHTPPGGVTPYRTPPDVKIA